MQKGSKGTLRRQIRGFLQTTRFLIVEPAAFLDAFCSPAKSLTFSGSMENPLVLFKKRELKSPHPLANCKYTSNTSTVPQPIRPLAAGWAFRAKSPRRRRRRPPGQTWRAGEVPLEGRYARCFFFLIFVIVACFFFFFYHHCFFLFFRRDRSSPL